jgi:hypothetical protein
MHLHQVAAEIPRAWACRGVPFPSRKARILSNDAEFPQGVRFKHRRSRTSNAEEARLMIRGGSFMIKVDSYSEHAVPSHVVRGKCHG